MFRRARFMSEAPLLQADSRPRICLPSAPAREGREQAEVAPALDSLSAPMRSELPIEVADMRIDGVHRPRELRHDLRMSEVGRQAAQHAPLALGEGSAKAC